MKNYKEFKKAFREIIDFEEEVEIYNAYECYLLGVVDGKEELFKALLSASMATPIPMPTTFPLPEELAKISVCTEK